MTFKYACLSFTVGILQLPGTESQIEVVKHCFMFSQMSSTRIQQTRPAMKQGIVTRPVDQLIKFFQMNYFSLVLD